MLFHFFPPHSVTILQGVDSRSASVPHTKCLSPCFFPFSCLKLVIVWFLYRLIYSLLSSKSCHLCPFSEPKFHSGRRWLYIGLIVCWFWLFSKLSTCNTFFHLSFTNHRVGAMVKHLYIYLSVWRAPSLPSKAFPLCCRLFSKITVFAAGGDATILICLLTQQSPQLTSLASKALPVYLFHSQCTIILREVTGVSSTRYPVDDTVVDFELRLSGELDSGLLFDPSGEGATVYTRNLT